MNQIQIDNQPYNLPESWQEISITQFGNLRKVIEINSNAERAIQIILSVTDIPELILRDAEHRLLDILIDQLQFINNPPVLKEISSQCSFHHNGELYFVNTLDKASIGEYADFESYSVEYKDNIEAGIPYLLAILSRKKIDGIPEKYGSYDLEERATTFKSLSCITASELSNFFLNNSLLLNHFSLLSTSLKEQVAQKMQHIETSLKNMDGSGFFGRMRKKTLQKLMQLQKQTVSSFLKQ